MLDENDKRVDVQAEYPVYVDVTNEDNNYLMEKNALKCQNPTLCLEEVNREGEGGSVSLNISEILSPEISERNP